MTRRSTTPVSAATPRQRSSPDSLFEDSLSDAISDFGRTVSAKFEAGDGSPEDHLRAPFETLLRTIGRTFGMKVVSVGETRKPQLGIRPDYAIEVAGAGVGYVERKRRRGSL